MNSSATAELPYLDLADPSFSARGEAIRSAREQGWCARTNYGLAVLRAAEIRELLKDRRLRQGLHAWPAQNGITDGLLADWWADVITNVEGTDHKRLRRLVNPAFGPRVIAGFEPGFRRLSEELVDGFAAAGRCEFVADFAKPYAARALIEMLGLDHGDWMKVSEWSSDISRAFGVNIAAERGRIEAALGNLYAYTEELIAARREAPGEDAISRLVGAQEDGDQLSDTELGTMISALIFAGMDTTSNQLALALQIFLQHPDQWRLLGDDPALAESAVEEVMRVSPTVLWITREATEDFVFEGLEIERGTTLHVFPESGNTDPLFVAEEGFDITASRPRHFGFGAGPHHCLGHFLARADMREALGVLAERLRNPRLDGVPEHVPESGLWGPVSLPIAFDVGGPG